MKYLNRDTLYKSIIVVMVLFVFTACGGEKNGKKGGGIASEESMELRYSQLLKITECDGYTKVEVRGDKDSATPLATYILVPRGSSAPSNLPEGEVLEVPLKNVVAYTSVHASLLKELGSIDVVKGVADAAYFKIPEIKKGLEDGSVADLGNSSSPSIERLIELSPEAVMISIYEGMNVQDLSKQGVTYLKFTDNLERTPLGRAEWVKFMGLLVGKSHEAERIFSEVESRYNDLKRKAADVSVRPKVLVENMYEGVWYLPAGGSYMAVLLADSGADYPWSGTEGTGSLSLTFEEVFEKAGDADFWVLKTFGVCTPESLLAQDKRYAEFKPFIDGGVYCCDTSESMLFEEFPFHPDLLLADYIKIFHPELASEYQLRYFSPIGNK